MTVGALQIDRIEAEFRRKRIGRHIEYLESTNSTNDDAWMYVEADDADGLVIFAEYQSAGRGRSGRTWHSPRGAGLLCSVLLIDERAELTGGELGLVAAVATRDAIVACTDVVPVIKWPNDLLVLGRKLGGILTESRLRYDGVRAYVVGIGINCLQQRGHLVSTLGDSATSLELESAYPVDRTALAISLLTELDRWLGEPRTWDDACLRREWLARAEPMGRHVCLQHSGQVFSGLMIDLDPSSALVVQLDEGGIRAFDAGTTTIMTTDAEGERHSTGGQVGSPANHNGAGGPEHVTTDAQTRRTQAIR